MKKIENIIDSCTQCPWCGIYEGHRRDITKWAAICHNQDRLLLLTHEYAAFEDLDIPDWCPLETYTEAEKSEAQLAAPAATPSTIILPGMPGLEWMTENLSGFGGTEIDGRTYYTYDEAEEAVKQLRDGWRLPTREEFEALRDLGSTWDDDRKGRWFGGNHETDHAGSLFLPASGYRLRETGALDVVGTFGYSWSSSPYAAGIANGGFLGFGSGYVNPLDYANRALGFPVRCVRNVK